jgi:4'-phosphopantetheinyl transferase
VNDDEVAGDTQVDVWPIALDRPPGEVEALATLLDRRELADACSRVRGRDRDRLIVARAVRRQVLARCLDLDPSELAYALDRWGRPTLDPVHGSSLRFSNARSGDHAVVATTSGRRVGIDLELLRSVPEASTIAATWFDPATREQLVVQPRDGRDGWFLSRWTVLEATLKATGDGLAPDAHEVRLGDVATGVVGVRGPGGAGCWATWPLTAWRDAGAVVAVVTEPPRGHVAWRPRTWATC